MSEETRPEWIKIGALVRNKNATLRAAQAWQIVKIDHMPDQIEMRAWGGSPTYALHWRDVRDFFEPAPYAFGKTDETALVKYVRSKAEAA